MSFERSDFAHLDAPHAFQQLASLGVVPLAPVFLLASGAAVAATVNGWLSNDDWSPGEYNNMMREIHDTITLWDTLGWKSGCWNKNKLKRKEWMAFWGRFSKHYATYGNIPDKSWLGDQCLTCYVSDSAEKPVRNNLLPELKAWGAWLNETCKAGIDLRTIGDQPPPKPPPKDDGGVLDYLKWGAVGLLALVGLQAANTVRSFRR